MRQLLPALFLLPILLSLPACGGTDHCVVIRGGTIYDGTGSAPFEADLAVNDDRIVAIGDLSGKTGALEIDASGLAVAPGFINMLSWANVSLIQDGRSMSAIRQGVTLEIMGEGTSMGPLNEVMRQEKIDRQSDIKYDVSWTTLGEYLQHLEDRGISTNVASFVGATQVRQHEIGYEDRPATVEEMERMKELSGSAPRSPTFRRPSPQPRSSSSSPARPPSTTGCTSPTSATKVTRSSRP